MPNYGDPQYWIQRYKEQNDTTFDWLEDYETIKPILEELGIPKSSRILNVGCGNSEFSEKMYDDGYVNNINNDICENVINYMKERNKTRKGLVFEVMDVKEMSYANETFDVVIDKSTIDAWLCGDHSFMNVAAMTKEISRVWKTGGIYFIISYGKPENRVFHWERDHLDFQIEIYTMKKEEEEGKDKTHFGYVCRKGEKANENWNNFELVYKEWEQDEIEEQMNGEEGEEEDEEEEDIKDEGEIA